MSVTTYTQFDLINQNIFVNSLTNCANTGTLPNINFIGLINDNPFTLLTTDVSKIDKADGNVAFSYDLDHASPINPLPSNARITAVDVRMIVTGPATSANVSVNFPSNAGFVQASGALTALIIPSPMDTSLGTNVSISATDTQTSTSSTGVRAKTSSLSPAGIIIRSQYDFTTNPGGLFPLGYMTYADFIANFLTIVFSFHANGEGHAQWQFGGAHSANAVGTFVGSCGLVADTFEMEVTWEVPLSWTINTPTVTYPTNILDISRPALSAPANPDDDTENIESIFIDDREIFPDDPWVIIWTRIHIRIHYPPDPVPDPPNNQKDIDVTVFSGRVPLGTVTVVVANLSGIYTFNEDVHTDTLYARTTTSTTVTTQAVAIPAPMFVTSFFDNEEEDILHYTGVRMRVVGSGVLKTVVQSLDYINTELLADLTLRSVNNVNPFLLCNFVEQDASLRVYMDTLGDFMNFSKLVMFSKNIFTGYPQ
jgi:hypothetical protein